MFRPFLHWSNPVRQKKGKKTTYGMQIETYFASAKAWAGNSNMIDKLQKWNRRLGWQRDVFSPGIYVFCNNSTRVRGRATPKC